MTTTPVRCDRCKRIWVFSKPCKYLKRTKNSVMLHKCNKNLYVCSIHYPKVSFCKAHAYNLKK